MVEQPEFWQWAFDYYLSRGWIRFEGGAWRASATPELTRKDIAEARGGKEGAGKKAGEKLPPALLLECLHDLGGRARWEDWRALAQEKSGARVGKLWGFYHAIKPLLKAGRVRKAYGGFYQLEELKPAANQPAAGGAVLVTAGKVDRLSGMVVREVLRHLDHKHGRDAEDIAPLLPEAWGLSLDDIAATLEECRECKHAEASDGKYMLGSEVCGVVAREEDKEWLAWQGAHKPRKRKPAAVTLEPETLDL